MSSHSDSSHPNGTPLPPPPPLPPFASDSFLAATDSRPYNRSSGRSSADRSDAMDVMAQLASQYYTPSRNRSFSAPIQPSALGSAWDSFADDSSVSAAAAASHHHQHQMVALNRRPCQPPLPQGPPPPVLHIRVPSLPSGEEMTIGAIDRAVQSLHLSCEETDETSQQQQQMFIASSPGGTGAPLPATFLRTICDQLEYYFCDENLLGDLFLLKNMNMDGYVKLELLASFGRVKKLTVDMDEIKKALELSTKLLLNEDGSMVCRKEPLAPNQTYHGKLARTAIAYNLPEDASVASLRDTFQGCGEISYLRLLKKNTTTGRNAVLKPPIAAGETYAIIEFVDDEMTKHAVLTLSDQYNWRTGMQVVLFDGTNCDKLKQKMFPVELGGDRRRAKSASAVTRPVHVESVGEGLDDLREGKVNTGTVYSIRGAGGLITPTRQDSACISFRLIPDEDGNVDIRQGDYVSFTVGKNKKSGRKYASKVKLEFRPPANLTGDADNGGDLSGLTALSGSSASGNGQKDYFAPSPSRWESRSRSATMGAPQQPAAFRTRSSSSGTRSKLNLASPRMAQSPVHNNNVGGNVSVPPPPGMGLNGSTQLYRQAVGPDGTRGFGFRLTGGEPPEMAPEFKFPVTERRRSRSSGGAW